MEMIDAEQVFEMFPDLDFAEEDRRLLKEEMNGMLNDMDKEELKQFFSKEEFDENYKLIELNKYPFEKALMLLKHIGHKNAKKPTKRQFFTNAFLKKRFGRVILEEGKKKEEKDEKLLIDLCECCLFWCERFDPTIDGLLVICVPCLLKVALNKEESKEAQKEIEYALLALSGFCEEPKMPEELYSNEIKEIIQHHQKHHNLTRLAYQSAWQFLYCRKFDKRETEEAIMNELHFVREAISELEELMGCIDWKSKEEDGRGKEREEVITLIRWLQTLESLFLCRSWNEEHAELIRSVARVYLASKDSHRDVSYWCIDSFRCSAYNRAVNINELLKNGAIELVLSEMNCLHDEYSTINSCEPFIRNLCERLNEKMEGESDEKKRKETKKKVLENLEEDGYEDCIIMLRHYKTKGILGEYCMFFKIENYFLCC
ncbi:uncharacterized protein MONOS_2707 [Monocercomonoides exilis]|uniref:uncharacterized protein n=1 Tax=Monocercomonoides exilis TaxID=2049356 RepID=UPI003559BD32|nr:hypothetical protein MONOS_2707 [Monocercomonoides exilis]